MSATSGERYADLSARVLADPAASYWLKEALRAAQARDPVDAAADAARLAQLMELRMRDVLGGRG